MSKEITIGVVDDHPLFREGVMRILAEIPGFRIVGEGSTSEEALSLSSTLKPSILLMDISMPGGGLNAIEPILQANPAQKIIMLTVSETGDDVMSALSKGAKAYVLKGVGSRILADIVRSVDAGDTYVSPSLSARLLSDMSSSEALAKRGNPIDNLTTREQEVLNLVAEGLSNKRIALRLSVHEKTIKQHMTHIFAKLGISNRTEAAMTLRDATART
ncbi:response regulator transcription factor [Rhizobium sp. LjRoot98]|uniref:LuxR C-terminal-related transcriptional regulator n=1 Tax=unclassified Rhizobium TaxID=2613769 RepID=UPI00071400AE|nr:response regulator transcription factor [Rhizobium sp. Root1204]KQV35263.1 two-component system response regulator [Rhizobium sp. Root1204]